jgi:hypothetical protein
VTKPCRGETSLRKPPRMQPKKTCGHRTTKPADDGDVDSKHHHHRDTSRAERDVYSQREKPAGRRRSAATTTRRKAESTRPPPMPNPNLPFQEIKLSKGKLSLGTPPRGGESRNPILSGPDTSSC